jgi:hypothetical protein
MILPENKASQPTQNEQAQGLKKYPPNLEPRRLATGEELRQMHEWITRRFPLKATHLSYFFSFQYERRSLKEDAIGMSIAEGSQCPFWFIGPQSIVSDVTPFRHADEHTSGYGFTYYFPKRFGIARSVFSYWDYHSGQYDLANFRFLADVHRGDTWLEKYIDPPYPIIAQNSTDEAQYGVLSRAPYAIVFFVGCVAHIDAGHHREHILFIR